MRSATVKTDPNEGRDLVDMLVLPELADIELRDWKAYDAAVEAGYDAAIKAIDGASQLAGLVGGSTVRAA